MRRRDFVKGIVGSTAWPLAARAQQIISIARLGVLLGIGENDKTWVKAFQRGLRDLGWFESQNIMRTAPSRRRGVRSVMPSGANDAPQGMEHGVWECAARMCV
jgi:hypothetical protein